MDNELIWVLASVGFIIGCLVLLMVMVSYRKRLDLKKEGSDVNETISQPPTAATTAQAATPATSPPPATSSTPYRDTTSTMEQRELAMCESMRSGRCMYCNERAELSYPRYKRVRSIFDGMLRWLGVKQLDRWRVSIGTHWMWYVLSLGIASRETPVLCIAHQQRIVGLLEEHLVQETRDISKYLNNQCLALYEFGVSEVHGVVSGEMKLLRDPKAAKAAKKQQAQQAATSGTVVELASRQPKQPQSSNGG